MSGSIRLVLTDVFYTHILDAPLVLLPTPLPGGTVGGDLTRTDIFQPFLLSLSSRSKSFSPFVLLKLELTTVSLRGIVTTCWPRFCCSA